MPEFRRDFAVNFAIVTNLCREFCHFLPFIIIVIIMDMYSA